MRIIVDMPEAQVKELNARSAAIDRSRAWLIRAAVDVYLNTTDTRDMPDMPARGETLTVVHPFKPSPRNALRCVQCGARKANH